jgi:hypothetical protein
VEAGGKLLGAETIALLIQHWRSRLAEFFKVEAGGNDAAFTARVSIIWSRLP